MAAQGESFNVTTVPFTQAHSAVSVWNKDWIKLLPTLYLQLEIL